MNEVWEKDLQWNDRCICLYELTRTRKGIGQKSRSDRESNRSPPEHKSESLPLEPPCSVLCLIYTQIGWTGNGSRIRELPFRISTGTPNSHIEGFSWLSSVPLHTFRDRISIRTWTLLYTSQSNYHSPATLPFDANYNIFEWTTNK